MCWFFSGISSLRVLRAFVVKNLVKSKPITGGTREKYAHFFLCKRLDISMLHLLYEVFLFLNKKTRCKNSYHITNT